MTGMTLRQQPARIARAASQNERNDLWRLTRRYPFSKSFYINHLRGHESNFGPRFGRYLVHNVEDRIWFGAT